MVLAILLQVEGMSLNSLGQLAPNFLPFHHRGCRIHPPVNKQGTGWDVQDLRWKSDPVPLLLIMGLTWCSRKHRRGGHCEALGTKARFPSQSAFAAHRQPVRMLSERHKHQHNLLVAILGRCMGTLNIWHPALTAVAMDMISQACN